MMTTTSKNIALPDDSDHYIESGLMTQVVNRTRRLSMTMTPVEDDDLRSSPTSVRTGDFDASINLDSSFDSFKGPIMERQDGRRNIFSLTKINDSSERSFTLNDSLTLKTESITQRSDSLKSETESSDSENMIAAGRKAESPESKEATKQHKRRNSLTNAFRNGRKHLSLKSLFKSANGKSGNQDRRKGLFKSHSTKNVKRDNPLPKRQMRRSESTNFGTF